MWWQVPRGKRSHGNWDRKSWGSTAYLGHDAFLMLGHIMSLIMSRTISKFLEPVIFSYDDSTMVPQPVWEDSLPNRCISTYWNIRAERKCYSTEELNSIGNDAILSWASLLHLDWELIPPPSFFTWSFWKLTSTNLETIWRFPGEKGYVPMWLLVLFSLNMTWLGIAGENHNDEGRGFKRCDKLAC